MITQNTEHIGLPLPHRDNDLKDDVERLRAALIAIDLNLKSIANLLSSDTTTLDTVQEIVDAIKADESNITAMLTGKAPAVHSHEQADVNGLPTALAGKAQSVHGHAQADITGLATALAGKAPSVHGHAISDVDGLALALSTNADAIAARLLSSSYTASEVLAKVKTVDGAGSGLDADLFDGLESTSFAKTNGVYTAAQLHNNTTLESGIYTTDAAGLGNFNNSAIYLPGWWHVINMKHMAATGFNAQLAVELSSSDAGGYNGARMFMRVAEGGAWSEWAPVDTCRYRIHASATAMAANCGDYIFTYGNGTITLPSAPKAGECVTVCRWQSTTCTITRNGGLIMQIAEDLTVDAASTVVFRLRFTEASIGWIIE